MQRWPPRHPRMFPEVPKIADPPHPPASPAPSEFETTGVYAQPEGASIDTVAFGGSPPPRQPEVKSSASTQPSGTPFTIDAAVLALPENERVFGPFVLTKKLGQGGMGAVYQAWHTKLKIFVAIKTLRPELTQSADALARFELEIASTAKAKHPHLIAAYHADTLASGVHYLVMDFVDGQDLAKVVATQGPFSATETRRLIQLVADGLHYVHSLGIIHRDVKPGNILLTPEGVPKLTDLGLARLTIDHPDRAANGNLTSTGVYLGTPAYMSPEHANGQPIDARSDVYSLGATAYFLLTGRILYPKHNVAQSIQAHGREPLPDFPESVPPQLVRVLEKGLAADPRNRYQTAAEFRNALD